MALSPSISPQNIYIYIFICIYIFFLNPFYGSIQRIAHKMGCWFAKGLTVTQFYNLSVSLWYNMEQICFIYVLIFIIYIFLLQKLFCDFVDFLFWVFIKENPFSFPEFEEVVFVNWAGNKYERERNNLNRKIALSLSSIFKKRLFGIQWANRNYLLNFPLFMDFLRKLL